MYAPGESPFHTRGSTYIGVRDYMTAQVPGGVDAVANALPDGPHRAFVRQAFVADEWYDALPMRSITEIMARLERRAWDESVRARAQTAALRELKLVGRLLLAASSPERVIEKLERSVLQQFDFGESKIVEAEPGRVKLVLEGIPQPLGSWFLPMLDGYATTMLGKAGGKQPQVSGRLIPRGRRDAIGLVEIWVDMSWGR